MKTTSAANTYADVTDHREFCIGLRDALPIFWGYLSVGFAFGMLAVKTGFPIWAPILMSMTQLSGTGQFATVHVTEAGGGVPEIILAVTVLNLRYVLMALSISQKIDPSMPAWKRMIAALGDTDEIIAVALKRNTLITLSYMAGLTACSYAGWNLGTILVAAGASFLSPNLIGALGMALYAMFVAIIIPEARANRAVLFTVCTAAAANIVLRILPHAVRPADSWTILISGVAAACAGAALNTFQNRRSRRNPTCSRM